MWAKSGQEQMIAAAPCMGPFIVESLHSQCRPECGRTITFNEGQHLCAGASRVVGQMLHFHPLRQGDGLREWKIAGRQSWPGPIHNGTMNTDSNTDWPLHALV